MYYEGYPESMVTSILNIAVAAHCSCGDAHACQVCWFISRVSLRYSRSAYSLLCVFIVFKKIEILHVNCGLWYILEYKNIKSAENSPSDFEIYGKHICEKSCLKIPQ